MERKIKVDILSLKQYQEINIENEKYIVINQIKYIEKNSYWYEYKLLKDDNKEEYYLNVELSGKAILYKELKEKIEINAVQINYNNKTYSLFETGTGIVNICYGVSDLAMHDEVMYYEYTNDNNENEIISVEKWRNRETVSIGYKIDKIKNW